MFELSVDLHGYIMQRTRKFRNRLLATAAFALLLATAPTPANAASKEIIQLQTQVQQLTDMVQRIQSTLDTRFGILQNLVQQTTDNANQVTATVNALSQKISTQSDTSSSQIQSLNDSVDELKSRVSKLDKSIQDMESQLQNVQSAPSAASTNAPSANPNPAGADAHGNQAPPLKETYQAGIRDYNTGRYEIATSEFQDVLHYYPQDELSGMAQFYLGEIAYRHQNYDAAVKAYNALLEGYPGSPKAASAALRKGLALLQLNQKTAGIHELRLLIQRHPQTPEAVQARTKLNAMGVKSTTR
jgi:tol-pal system protein YbgF